MKRHLIFIALSILSISSAIKVEGALRVSSTGGQPIQGRSFVPAGNVGKTVQTSQLNLISYLFKPIAGKESIQSIGLKVEDSSTQLFNVLQPVSIEGIPMAYPNPFRQEEGTYLRYVLSKPTDISVKIYDMRANLVSDKTIPSGASGANYNVNYLKFDLDSFDRVQLSAGVYFYVIMGEGRVLGKGKLALVP